MRSTDEIDRLPPNAVVLPELRLPRDRRRDGDLSGLWNARIQSSGGRTMTDEIDDPYLDRLKRAAIVGAVYGIVSLVGLMWLLWQGQPLYAVGWTVVTSFVWKTIIDPLLDVDGAFPEYR
jgi:hypothetical protein